MCVFVCVLRFHTGSVFYSSCCIKTDLPLSMRWPRPYSEPYRRLNFAYLAKIEVGQCVHSGPKQLPGTVVPRANEKERAAARQLT